MKQIKKSITVVAALLLMGSGFANTAYGNDCQDWAETIALGEITVYGPMTNEEYEEAVSFYYESCEDAGGSIYMSEPAYL